MAKKWVKTSLDISTLLPNSINEIELDGDVVAFAKTDDRNEIIVFQNKCSHMGDPLRIKNQKIVCATHGWTFNAEGENENKCELGLRRLHSKSESNELFIEMPTKPHKLSQNNSLPPTVKVHSHACLEITWRNFSILTDPWITGDAYYGSWKLWPQPTVSPQDLKVDAIVITHPHPDHFHPETLNHFDKKIPVYFPNFLSNIIGSGLTKLGFENLNPCNFADEIYLKENISIQFFKPTSAWEDSVALLSIDGFKILNQNDAGAVFEDDQLPEKIDLLACAFDQGASGYPLTWENLSEKRKNSILNHQKAYTLRRIVDLCNRYSATLFLPFAGHWRLKLAIHSQFSEKIPHTYFHEISDQLNKGSKTQLLELYPGEYTDFVNPPVLSEAQRDLIENRNVESNSVIPDFKALTKQDVEKIDKELQELKKLKRLFNIEDVVFSVSLGETLKFEVDLREETSEKFNHIEVSVPEYIGRVICDQAMNWDHIAIGYWGKWTRSLPDYPTNFMRALQIGSSFLSENVKAERVYSISNNILKSNVASLAESNPDLVQKVFNRYGLPCMGCYYGQSEDLESAIDRHRLPIGSKEKIVNELNILNDMVDDK